MAPQIIMVIFISYSLGVSLCQHGKPRENHNFLYDLISIGLLVFILVWGGFFSVFCK